MRHPLTRSVEHVLEHPTLFEVLLGLILLAALAALVRASLLLRRDDARAARWLRLPGALGLLAVLVGTAGMALRTVLGHETIEKLGHNVTPADLYLPYAGGLLTLAFGVLVGAVGLVATWILEWVRDGRMDPTRPPR